MDKEFKLCYIDESFAYFTTQKLEDQWGDDWNDAPYEHNAGEPYYPREGDDWKIIKVAFDGCFDRPTEYTINSSFSVEDINARAIPWLYNRDNKIAILAGINIEEFCELIEKAGGIVYLPKEKKYCAIGYPIYDCPSCEGPDTARPKIIFFNELEELQQYIYPDGHLSTAYEFEVLYKDQEIYGIFKYNIGFHRINSVKLFGLNMFYEADEENLIKEWNL